MVMKKDSKRVVIFIDGSNHYHILKRLLPEKKALDFNFEKFANYITKEDSLMGIYYYNAPLDREKDEKSYARQQKFFDKIKRISKFHLVLCRMLKRKVNNVMIYEVKEDDIHLAVDMVRLAYDNAYDKAILVSSDGDFVPAVNAVKKRGKIVENIGFENKFSWHLKQKCDSFKKLTKKELIGLFD